MSKDIYKVYKITNSVNDKVYIGITENLRTRWNIHKSHVRNKLNRPLYNAMNKYGIDKFKITTICSTKTREDMGIIEQQLIKEHNTMAPNGYNLTTGGEMAYTVSEETREKQRQRSLGRTHTKESRQKMSESLKGRVVSKETRQRISESSKGKVISKEVRQKMSDAKRGKYLPDDQVSEKALYMRRLRERQRLQKSYKTTPKQA